MAIDIQTKQVANQPSAKQFCPKFTPTSTSTPTPTPTICGSRGLPPCAAGQTCVPNPKTPNCDPRADCPGICAVSDGSFCGGIGGFPCPLAGQTCIDNPNDSCDPNKGGRDCSGICAFLDPLLPPPVVARSRKIPTPTTGPKPTGAPCGGFRGTPCESDDEVCIDDPSDDCDPMHGGADCPGVCVARSPPSCGGIAAIPCPSKDQVCVDNPNDDCDPQKGGADCPSICVPRPRPTGPPCGGFAGRQCPSKDQKCIDDPSDDCDPKNGGADCIGICVGGTGSTPILSVRAAPKFASCGGFTGKKCPRTDQKCVDDPRDSCDPKNGGADCPEICVGAACGGFAGLKCKAGETCVDDPRDSCDPSKGGADCIGVCI